MRHADVHRGERPAGLLAIIVAALVIGVAATVLSVVNLVAIGDEADTREAERLAADLAACERSNDLRRQTAAIGDADRQLLVDAVTDVLAVLGSRLEPERLEAVQQALEPALEAHRRVVDAIELIDCPASTPGADNGRGNP